MVNTIDQFPDLEEELGGKKKGKKQAKVRNPVQKVEPENDVMLTPYKGKPSSFFVMSIDLANSNEMNPSGYTLNDEQWSFVFLYYPEYAQAPYDMMCWLLG